MFMTENENQNSEVQEVAPQVETKVTEINDAAKARQEADERNWKAMRIKNEDLEKRVRQFEDMQMQMMQAQLANSAPSKQEVDEFDAIGSDEFIPKGKVEKLVEKKAQKYAEEIARKEVEKALQQRDQSQFMDKLQRQYNDFSEIVNAETLSLLEEKEPELAKTIADLKDPYKIGIQSYKYIKAMNLQQSAPESRRQKETQKAIEKSEKAVPSPMSFDKRPIAAAFQLTEAMKKDLYREMNGYAALADSVPEMS